MMIDVKEVDDNENKCQLLRRVMLYVFSTFSVGYIRIYWWHSVSVDRKMC